MPLENPFLHPGLPSFTADPSAVRCKRKMWEMDAEDCVTSNSKREKREEMGQHQSWPATYIVNPVPYPSQMWQQNHYADQGKELSMDVLHNNSSLPLHPQHNPATTHTTSVACNTLGGGDMPMMDVEEEGAHHADPRHHHRHHHHHSSQYRNHPFSQRQPMEAAGHPSSISSCGTQPSSQDGGNHWHWPDDHYVSDIY